MDLKIKKGDLIYKGITFDDWSNSDGDDAFPYWATVCGECLKEYKDKLTDTSIYESPAEEICGIEGCSSKEETNYINFPKNPPKSIHFLKSLNNEK